MKKLIRPERGKKCSWCFRGLTWACKINLLDEYEERLACNFLLCEGTTMYTIWNDKLLEIWAGENFKKFSSCYSKFSYLYSLPSVFQKSTEFSQAMMPTGKKVVSLFCIISSQIYLSACMESYPLPIRMFWRKLPTPKYSKNLQRVYKDWSSGIERKACLMYLYCDQFQVIPLSFSIQITSLFSNMVRDSVMFSASAEEIPALEGW